MAVRNIIPRNSLSIPKVKLPEKFKGTIVEKWTVYWKNLILDYTQAVKDLRTDIQDEPKKALKYFTAGLTAYLLFDSNPTELDFKNEVRKLTNAVILVSEECRKPEAMEHLRTIQIYQNRDVLNYQSFGLFSILYRTEFGSNCDLYKAHCKYLKPSYFSMLDNVVDFGIAGKWWNLYIKTSNYDVNI